MLCPTLAVHSSLFLPPKLRSDTLICQCALQDKQQDGGGGMELLPMKCFILCLKQRFYVLADTMLGVILYSEVVSSKENFNFHHYYWNIFKDIKSPTCKFKIVTLPGTFMLCKHNKLRKHQVNLIQKQSKIKRVFLFYISISSSNS